MADVSPRTILRHYEEGLISGCRVGTGKVRYLRFSAEDVGHYFARIKIWEIAKRKRKSAAKKPKPEPPRGQGIMEVPWERGFTKVPKPTRGPTGIMGVQEPGSGPTGSVRVARPELEPGSQRCAPPKTLNGKKLYTFKEALQKLGVKRGVLIKHYLAKLIEAHDFGTPRRQLLRFTKQQLIEYRHRVKDYGITTRTPTKTILKYTTGRGAEAIIKVSPRPWYDFSKIPRPKGEGILSIPRPARKPPPGPRGSTSGKKPPTKPRGRCK